jgi:acetyl esterase/lipase
MTASSTALPTTGDTDAATAYSIRTVQYATVLGYRPLELDVHTVTGAARTRGLAGAAGAPVIVWIHGGGWEAGSRSDHPPVLDGFYRRFADAGYVVVSIDYRLSREVSFPACLHDCKAAIRWVRTTRPRRCRRCRRPGRTAPRPLLVHPPSAQDRRAHRPRPGPRRLRRCG